MMDQIRQALGDRNLVEVAKATGYSSQTLYRIKRGSTTPHKSTQKALAKYLKLDLETE